MVINGKIDISTSDFMQLRLDGSLYVDKTKIIENFLLNGSRVQLICRQRRLGKSLNLSTVYHFLSDKEDSERLFDGLYIKSSEVWSRLNSAPVFLFDLKNLNKDTYKKDIWKQIRNFAVSYSLLSEQYLDLNDYINDKDYTDPKGLKYLTEAVYRKTGKACFVLIDEYDNLLMRSYTSPEYKDIKEFLSDFYSAGLKGNDRQLAKALLTGITVISKEGMLSGLNNIKIFDIFSDKTFIDDYGLTEEEIDELVSIYNFDKQEMKNWYNGVMIAGKPIYNMFSVMNAIDRNEMGNYWQSSNILTNIVDLLDGGKKETISRLVIGEKVNVSYSKRMLLEKLFISKNDSEFYSFLIQTGYLAFHPDGSVVIPNIELKHAWNDFILEDIFNTNIKDLQSVFYDREPALFAERFEEFFSNRLSYLDFPEREKSFQLFTFVFLLSAIRDGLDKHPITESESGKGRADIVFERAESIYIFEFKYASKKDNLYDKANEALNQINENQYYLPYLDISKPIYKVGVANHTKECRVVCELH